MSDLSLLRACYNYGGVGEDWTALAFYNAAWRCFYNAHCWAATLLLQARVCTVTAGPEHVCRRRQVLPLVINLNATGFGCSFDEFYGDNFTMDDLGSNSHSGPAGLRARLNSMELSTQLSSST